MTTYSIIKSKLEAFKDFRERRFRGKYLMKLALREMGCEKKYYEGLQLTEEEMIEFAKKYDTYRHEWDCVMRDEIILRGLDYDDKKKIVQKKLIEFGYEVGFYQLTQ